MVRTNIGTANVIEGQAETIDYTIPSDARIGANTLYGVYQENDTYEQATGTSTLTILIPTVTTVNNVLASIGETATFTATVKYDTTRNVDTGRVQFKLGGANIGTPVDVIDGTATLQYEIPSNAETGTIISAVFVAEDTYANSEDNNGLLSIRGNSNVTITNLSGNRGTSVEIVAGITNDGGVGIDGGSATLYIDNTQQGESVDVENGTATFTYSIGSEAGLGSHTIRVDYAQNDNYDGNTGTGTLIVRTPTTLTAVNVSGNKGGTAPIVIQVTDNNGTSITEGTVNITVGTDAPFTATVDSTGCAKIENYNIPQSATGIIEFTGQYVENDNYQGSSTATAGVLTIRKGVTVQLDDITAVLGETLLLYAEVTDENNDAVTMGTVEFEIE